MVRHLRGGGLLVILIYQHTKQVEHLTFFGQPAYTAISSGQMALKYDALLFPICGIRQPDGLSNAIEAEIPPTDAATMTQALMSDAPSPLLKGLESIMGCLYSSVIVA